MPFFEEVDSLGIIERHIQGVKKLEDKEAKTLLKTYGQIRGELRDRLDSMPGDTFSAQRLRGVLAQVDSALAAMSGGLKSDVKPASFEAAQSGIHDLLGEIKTFEKEFTGAVTPINLNAVRIATNTSNFLFNRFEASIDAYSEDVRAQLAQALTQGAIEEISFSELTRRLNRFLIGEQWKLERIGRTELHNIYNIGKLNGMTEVKSDFIPDLKKTLIHPMDSRTGKDSIALAREDLVVPIDEPFKFTWRGKLRVFMAPPDRPNDRAILVPFRDEWDA